jgi:hypothetical protein
VSAKAQVKNPVLGISTQSAKPKDKTKAASKKVLVKGDSQDNYLPFIIGSIFLVASGIIVFFQIRRRSQQL